MRCLDCGDDYTIEKGACYEDNRPNKPARVFCPSCGTDLKEGATVFHRSNPQMIMIVSKINFYYGHPKCSWIDLVGQPHECEFSLVEIELKNH